MTVSRIYGQCGLERASVARKGDVSQGALFRAPLVFLGTLFRRARREASPLSLLDKCRSIISGPCRQLISPPTS
jgi:hypothetical protein